MDCELKHRLPEQRNRVGSRRRLSLACTWKALVRASACRPPLGKVDETEIRATKQIKA